MKTRPHSTNHHATTTTPTHAAHAHVDLTVATSPREQKAYDVILPKARAIPADEVIQINLDLPTTASTCIAVAQRLLPFRAFLATLSDFRVAALDDLEASGLALMVAHADYRAAVSPTDGLDDLIAKGTLIRDQFVLWGNAFAGAGLIDRAVPEKLRSGIGYRDLAVALTSWVRVFRGTDWARVQASSTLTDDVLAEAEAISQRVLAIVGKRDLDPAKISAASDVRSRMFTVAMRNYDQVRRGATYMRWDFGDADEFAPSLFVKGPHARDKKDAGAQAPATSTATATPATPATPATHATPASATVAKSGSDHVGMPDSSPFTNE